MKRIQWNWIGLVSNSLKMAMDSMKIVGLIRFQWDWKWHFWVITLKWHEMILISTSTESNERWWIYLNGKWHFWRIGNDIELISNRVEDLNGTRRRRRLIRNGLLKWWFFFPFLVVFVLIFLCFIIIYVCFFFYKKKKKKKKKIVGQSGARGRARAGAGGGVGDAFDVTKWTLIPLKRPAPFCGLLRIVISL